MSEFDVSQSLRGSLVKPLSNPPSEEDFTSPELVEKTERLDVALSPSLKRTLVYLHTTQQKPRTEVLEEALAVMAATTYYDEDLYIFASPNENRINITSYIYTMCKYRENAKFTKSIRQILRYVYHEKLPIDLDEPRNASRILYSNLTPQTLCNLEDIETTYDLSSNNAIRAAIVVALLLHVLFKKEINERHIFAINASNQRVDKILLSTI